jgi:hypothetical protein
VTAGDGAVRRILPALVCLAASWAAMPLLPRTWGLSRVHGLFAGAALYYVAYARVAFPARVRGAGPGARFRPAGPRWRVMLARAAVFGAVLGALLYAVFEIYRGLDMRWHLATFAAWVLADDLTERLAPTRTRSI